MARSPTKARANSRRYYRANRERISERMKNYLKRKRAEDPEGYKERKREILLRHRYKIGSDDYFRLLLKQGGTCALCDRLPSDERTGVLNVDHDHRTGRVRGLLCRPCNTSLGQLGDDPRSLLRAFLYLVKHAFD